jgi:uncharacterized membrane protein YvbJ
VEYTKWDIWWGILYIILFPIDILFIIFGIVYHPVFEWFSVVLSWIIIILTYFFIKKRRSPLRKITKYNKKTEKFYITTKNKVHDYLKANIGNAYSANVLLNTLEENIKSPSLKKYIKKEGGSILMEMSSDGYIQIAQKNGKIHYFFPSD